MADHTRFQDWPKWAIIPWDARSGHHLPSGWVRCDGTNGTLDLTHPGLANQHHEDPLLHHNHEDIWYITRP